MTYVADTVSEGPGGLNSLLKHFSALCSFFPMMPRSNYKSIQPDVKDFCQKHGLVYEERGFWQGAYDILK